MHQLKKAHESAEKPTGPKKKHLIWGMAPTPRKEKKDTKRPSVNR